MFYFSIGYCQVKILTIKNQFYFVLKDKIKGKGLISRKRGIT